MSENIDTRVSPALHPHNVREIDGYDDSTAPYLVPTETAFSTAYEGVRAVFDARAQAAKNPTWNDAQQIIATSDFAQKHLDRITHGFDSVRANLDKVITAIEQQLNGPVESKAAASIAAEIRSHVKSMETAERHTFLQQAMDGGDSLTLSSVLGAPAYLSGLTADFQRTYIRMYHERNAPEVAKRLRAMKGAKVMIEERAGIVFTDLTKAVGAPPHKAKRLRDAKTASEKAFIMSDAA
jgi:hypothetical protein